ncbi:hypothetical protein [Morganella psychrotolerans]|uniref:Uncharacterized protein n=1 Tax=Morganella psychrotolerans TaxID=368603 RepID=A0A1B8HDQ2_9GAMM|nr:hypothetical protein [Morganella psychrotolerans]OBU07197.1 hypothetical protein AYY17_04015 [Morganella psychrotolerans]
MKKALLVLLLGIFTGGQALAANQVMCYTYLKKVKDVEIESLKVWCLGTTDGSQSGMKIPELLSMGYNVVSMQNFPYEYSEGGYTYDGAKLLLILEDTKFPNQDPAAKKPANWKFDKYK